MFQGSRAGLAVIALASLIAPSSAFAQTVAERAAGTGVRLNGFTLLPVVDLGAEFSDNVFGQDENEESDVLIWVDARADLISNWSVHSLAFNAEVLSREYLDFDSQSTTDWTLGSDGVLEITRRSRLRGGISYTDGSETVEDNPNTGLGEALEFSEIDVTAGGDLGFNRLELSLELSYNDLNFDDGVLFDGSVVNQDDRDRGLFSATAQANYLIGAFTEAFVSLTGTTRDFDGSGLVVRDSNGFEVLSGVSFRASPLVRGQFGIGYFSESFDAVGIEDEQGFSLRGALDWLPTPLISVALSAERGIRDAGLTDATSTVSTNADVSVDYEWRRNVILTGALSFDNADFVGLDREDTRFGVGIGAAYALNDTISLLTRLNRVDQDSSGAVDGREFVENTVFVGVRLQR